MIIHLEGLLRFFYVSGKKIIIIDQRLENLLKKGVVLL